MQIRNQKDFWAGALFVAFGLFFVILGRNYAFGSAERMGPGYFPTVVGSIQIGLGLLVSVFALSPKASEQKVSQFSWRTLLLILGPIVLFGLLLNPLGLIGSIIMLVALSSYASHEFTWKGMLVNTAVLVAICLVVFVYGLSLPFNLWPAFVGA